MEDEFKKNLEDGTEKKELPKIEIDTETQKKIDEEVYKKVKKDAEEK
jgi:hypothetical protein